MSVLPKQYNVSYLGCLTLVASRLPCTPERKSAEQTGGTNATARQSHECTAKNNEGEQSGNLCFGQLTIYTAIQLVTKTPDNQQTAYMHMHTRTHTYVQIKHHKASQILKIHHTSVGAWQYNGQSNLEICASGN